MAELFALVAWMADLQSLKVETFCFYGPFQHLALLLIPSSNIDEVGFNVLLVQAEI